jgi:hypothetical protein
LLSLLRSFHDERMADSVEQAVRSSVEEQAELPTPTGRTRLTVERIDARGVTLLFGPKRTPTFFSWACLEGVVDYLQGRDWLPVGANRDVSGNPDTLDWYLKQYVTRQTANYVAVLLSRAEVLELRAERPARVRLSSAWSSRT